MPPENTAERQAAMNPSAVTEAKVFEGLVYYFNGRNNEHVEIHGGPFVEVGKWCPEGQEETGDDYKCTYYAALAAGYGDKITWLCAQEGNPSEEEKTGNRKWLIHAGYDANHNILPLSPKDAKRIAGHINALMDQVSSFAR